MLYMLCLYMLCLYRSCHICYVINVMLYMLYMLCLYMLYSHIFPMFKYHMFI